MIVTTGKTPRPDVAAHAAELSSRLGWPLVPRGDETLSRLRRRYGTADILVVTPEGARLERPDAKPFFFHPNTAAFRIKRLERGDTDTMLEACQIQPGDAVLDATLGLGADAIVFAFAAGESGRVVGVESEELVAVLVEDGLRRWQGEPAALVRAMRRVEVVQAHHLDYLKSLPDRSFDVVYFDPMFHAPVSLSTGIAPLRALANEEPLTEAAVAEAVRVARRRVVLKEASEGRLYERFGFVPYRTNRHQVTYSFRDTSGGE